MIIAKTNLTLLFVALKNETEPYDLTDTQVNITFQYPDTGIAITRAAEITDAEKGKCQVQLLPTDLPEGGTCRYQIEVKFQDSTVSKSAISSFFIADSLGA